MIHATLFLLFIASPQDLQRREAQLKADLSSAATDETVLALAQFLRERGRYREAEPLYVRSTGINEEVHGKSSVEAAGSWMRLGALYQAEFKLDLAEAAARKAVLLFETLTGTESLDYAYASANLAAALAGQGQFARAEPLLRRAVFLVRQHVPEFDPAVSCLEANLGMVYLREGEFRKAEPLLRGVLARVDEADESGRASALAALAELSIAEGRWEEAEAEIRKAYRVLGDSAGVLRLKAAVETHSGDLRQAAVDLSRSIELFESAGGSQSPALAAVLSEYAKVLHRLRRNGEAKAARRRAKAIQQ